MSRLELRERILDCTACELHAKSSGPVPFTGPTPTAFAIVGEAPGADEDKAGEPFVGRAGKLLRGHLVRAGVDPAQAFICNTVSCFPNGTPRPASIGACRQNLWDQLALSEAPTILALGSVALAAFRPDLRITMAHGQTFSWSGRTVFTTFHPAAALRRVDWDEAMAADLLRFGNALNQGSWVGLTLDICAACRTVEDDMAEIHFDADSLPYCDKCWPTSPGGLAEKCSSLPTSTAPLPSQEAPYPGGAVDMVKQTFPGAEVVQ